MESLKNLISEIEGLTLDEKIKAINEVKQAIKKVSPFENEPVDCVQWVKEELVIANDYNPNTVAPPKWNCYTHQFKRTDTHNPLLYISMTGFTK